MGNFQRPLDYIDVAQRLREMREKYPELSMQQVDMKFMQVGGKDWVVYTAAAYRTPDDARPGIGTAWEPIPGPTPYTKDSEVQNAETAAWGRALVAIGADTKNGIASAEEVSNRSGNTQRHDAAEQRLREGFGDVTADGEIDPRIDAILKAAEQGENTFLMDLATKYAQYGKLSDKQLEAGFKQAAKILTTTRSAPTSDLPFEPVGGFGEEPF